MKNRSYRRVYSRHRSRITHAQLRGFRKLEVYRLQSPLINDAFNRAAPVLVEIGFGNGSALAEFAIQHPGWNCVGVEVFPSGIGTLVNRCSSEGIHNIRIVEGEGLTFLESIANECIDLLWVLFPDPWPKARHQKRRLVSPQFGATVAQKLKPSGKLQVATDWADYADTIDVVLNDTKGIKGGRVATNPLRETTKYERRGLKLGHQVTDFEYMKV